MRLGKTLIGGNLIELRGLGVISIRHQTPQVVGGESVVLVGGQLEPFLGRVGIARHPVAEEVVSSNQPTCKWVALLRGLAIQVDGLALAACDHGAGFVIVSQCDLGGSVAEIGGASKVVDPQRVVLRRPNARNGVHSTVVQSFWRGTLR